MFVEWPREVDVHQLSVIQSQPQDLACETEVVQMIWIYRRVAVWLESCSYKAKILSCSIKFFLIKLLFINHTMHLKTLQDFYSRVLKVCLGFFVYTKKMSERNVLECNDTLLQ